MKVFHLVAVIQFYIKIVIKFDLCRQKSSNSLGSTIAFLSSFSSFLHNYLVIANSKPLHVHYFSVEKKGGSAYLVKILISLNKA